MYDYLIADYLMDVPNLSLFRFMGGASTADLVALYFHGGTLLLWHSPSLWLVDEPTRPDERIV